MFQATPTPTEAKLLKKLSVELLTPTTKNQRQNRHPNRPLNRTPNRQQNRQQNRFKRSWGTKMFGEAMHDETLTSGWATNWVATNPERNREFTASTLSPPHTLLSTLRADWPTEIERSSGAPWTNCAPLEKASTKKISNTKISTNKSVTFLHHPLAM